MPAWVIYWHASPTRLLALIGQLQASPLGLWNRLFWDNAGRLKEILFSLVKFSYWRLPGMTEVHRQEGEGGMITLIRTLWVTNHLIPHWTGIKPKRDCIVTEKLKLPSGTAQFRGYNHVSGLGLSLHLSPVCLHVAGFFLMGEMVPSPPKLPTYQLLELSLIRSALVMCP